METYQFIITGKVQNVFYRKTIQQMAAFGHIQGYVKNLSDGTVKVVAFLYDDQLEDFKTLLQNGSPLSKVSDIHQEISKEEMLYDGFEIRY